MSSKQRIQLQPGYVLHSRAYRNTSAIVDIFTPEYGRIALVAKGIKRPQARQRTVLQLFQPLLISWVGGGDLATLTHAETHGKPLGLSGECLAGGFYMNELIVKMLHPHDPHLDLFSHYDLAVRELASMSHPIQTGFLHTVLRRFEIGLLASLGYGLLLAHEAHSNTPVQASAEYLYFVGKGPLKKDNLKYDDHQVGAVSVSGSTLLVLASDELSVYRDSYQAHKSMFLEVRTLLAAVIDHYIGHNGLRSREVFRHRRATDAQRSRSGVNREKTEGTP